MHKTLQYLILAGIVVWGLLMLEKNDIGIVPSDIWPFNTTVSDTTKDTRCEKYERDVEGDKILDYGDRFAQFSDGCW